MSQSVAYCLCQRMRQLSAVRLQRLPGTASLTVFNVTLATILSGTPQNDSILPQFQAPSSCRRNAAPASGRNTSVWPARRRHCGPWWKRSRGERRISGRRRRLPDCDRNRWVALHAQALPPVVLDPVLCPAVHLMGFLSAVQVHKAQPIRHYKPVALKKSEIPLTVPQSPNFSDRFRLWSWQENHRFPSRAFYFCGSWPCNICLFGTKSYYLTMFWIVMHF